MDEPVSRCFATASWLRCEPHDVSTGDAEEPIIRETMRRQKCLTFNTVNSRTAAMAAVNTMCLVTERSQTRWPALVVMSLRALGRGSVEMHLLHLNQGDVTKMSRINEDAMTPSR